MLAAMQKLFDLCVIMQSCFNLYHHIAVILIEPEKLMTPEFLVCCLYQMRVPKLSLMLPLFLRFLHSLRLASDDLEHLKKQTILLYILL